VGGAKATQREKSTFVGDVGESAVMVSALFVVSTYPSTLPLFVSVPPGSGETETKVSLNRLPVVSSNESIVAPEPPPGDLYRCRLARKPPTR
jgi:hypothetical protein